MIRSAVQKHLKCYIYLEKQISENSQTFSTAACLLEEELWVKAEGTVGMGCTMRCGGMGLPLVIPGERWSLSLCRRLLRSRESCLIG